MSDERVERFHSLLSQIEQGAKAIQAGQEKDIPTAMVRIFHFAREATGIALEVSREKLDEMEIR